MPLLRSLLARTIAYVAELSPSRGKHCHVDLDGGGTIRALNVRIEGMGARTTLSLRPERVIIACQEGEVENRLVGRVEELIYLGPYPRALVCRGNREFVVKIPNTDRNAALHEGMDVNLGWAAEDCRALDAPAEVVGSDRANQDASV